MARLRLDALAGVGSLFLPKAEFSGEWYSPEARLPKRRYFQDTEAAIRRLRSV